MNLEKIRNHRQCCRLIKKFGLNSELTKNCNESLLEISITRMEKFEVIEMVKSLEKDMQIHLINNPKVLQYSGILLRRGVHPNKLTSLLKGMSIEEVMLYKIGTIVNTLNNEDIPHDLLVIFLKYYKDAKLEQSQKKLLWNGLYHYLEYHKVHKKNMIAENRTLFYTKTVAGDILLNLKSYDECLECMAANPEVMSVMQLVSDTDNSYIRIDEENFNQIRKDSAEISTLLKWVAGFFPKDKFAMFCELWLENHALLYDLIKLKKKVLEGYIQEASQMIKNRITYIGFFYNEYLFSEEWNGLEMKSLLIYAITQKKKAFLSLIKNNLNLFKSLPNSSVLFQESFYRKTININTMNVKNLKVCQSMIHYPESILEVLSSRLRTFEEVEVFYKLPKRYVELYTQLCMSRSDERMKVIREVIKNECIYEETSIPILAEKLSKKPFSEWKQKIFSHILELNTEVCILLIINYDKLKHLIGDIKTVGEARYVAQNAEILCKEENMEAIRQKVLEQNSEWLNFKDKFQFTSEFIKEHKERIKNFIYSDGVHIMWTYYMRHDNKEEELRRLVTAELMGRFRELKYYQDDLSKELDYPITLSIKQQWMENLSVKEDSLCFWEADDLLSVMQIGEIPKHTCLSYINGQYSHCLLACHDSNKKTLYLSYGERIVLRAAIRLTKGSFKTPDSELNKYSNLEFADLCAQISKEKRSEEKLVLFLENPYISGLPMNKESEAINLIIRLMERKAKKLGAIFICSMSYSKWKPTDMIRSSFSMYISASKAGAQYLDSLSGSHCVDDEGNYCKNIFLIAQASM